MAMMAMVSGNYSFDCIQKVLDVAVPNLLSKLKADNVDLKDIDFNSTHVKDTVLNVVVDAINSGLCTTKM